MRSARTFAWLTTLLAVVSIGDGQLIKFDPNKVAAPKTPDFAQEMKLMDRLQFAPPYDKFDATISARNQQSILVYVQPNSPKATVYEYQVSLVPLSNSVRAEKLPGVVFASGTVLNGKQSISFSGCWPNLPDPSEIQEPFTSPFITKAQPRRALNLQRASGTKPEKSDPTKLLNQQIFDTGSATLYIRYLALDAKGNVLNRSNSIRLRLLEAVPTTQVATFSLVHRGGGGELKFEDFPTEKFYVEPPKNLTVRYYTTSGTAKRVGIQASRSPFPENSSRWLAPVFNKRWYAMPIKISPAKSTAPSAYLEQSIDLNGLFQKSGPKEQSLYLRTVILDATGGLIGAPSNAVVVRVGGPGNPIVVSGSEGKSPSQSMPPTPKMEVSWNVTYIPPVPRAADFERHMVTSRESGPLETVVLWNYLNPGKPCPANFKYPAGTKVFFANSGNAEKDWVETVTEAIKTAIDVLKTIVDYASEQYAKLQVALVSAVADATGLPPSVVNFALQCAMSAVGLPPQIPNFDQLMNQGLDYMVTQAVQAAGLPDSDFVKDTMKDGLKEMGKMLSDPPPGAPYYIPDRDFDYKPGFLKFSLKSKWNGFGSNMSPVPSKAFDLDVIASAAFTPDPSNLGTLYPSTEKLFYKNLPVPSMKDGETFNFSVPVSATDDYWLNRATSLGLPVTWQIGGRTTTKKIQEAWSL
ncbi:MAG: hypothetical protein WCK51_01805 [Armatimonadota bacterium]